MYRKRKRKTTAANGPQAGSPSTPAANAATPSPAAAAGPSREPRTPSILTDAFKSAFEKAADRSRTDLASKGVIKPTAFFVYADGAMMTVSLLVRDGHQQEAVIRRIRDKAIAENAFAVMTLTEMDRGRHEVVLSGVSPGIKASARVDYSFDNKTKTVTSWKITWLNQPVKNIFLDGVFDKTV